VREALVLKNLLSAREPARKTNGPALNFASCTSPARFVVHTHPAIVNGLTCSKNGRAHAPSFLVIKRYGCLILIRASHWPARSKICLKNSVGKVKKLRYYFASKPRLIISGDSIAEIEKTTAYVMNTISRHIKRNPDFSTAKADMKERLFSPLLFAWLVWAPKTGQLPYSTLIRKCRDG